MDQTGGNAGGGELSVVRRGQRQRFRWLHIRIRSMMGKTGKAKGGLGATTDTNEWLAAWHPALEWWCHHSW